MDAIHSLDWPHYQTTLHDTGMALLPALLTTGQCRTLAALYDVPDLYRRTISMKRHNFGSGEYKYFQYPLPPVVESLREALFSYLVPVANAWHETLTNPLRYPAQLADWLATCHAAGQTRPTPLILRYETGDWNALHQDMYGELYFPFQAVLFLSQPGADYTGGEFVVVEQRPRMQSKATVLQPQQGQVLIFSTKERPVRGSRGYYRVGMRHGVSEITSGNRVNLGLVFHDAA